MYGSAAESFNADLGQDIARIAVGVAHDVNQPIAAILIDAQAALRWLHPQIENLDEARHSLERIVGNSHRARNIFGSFSEAANRSLSTSNHVSLNALVQDLLGLLSQDLRRGEIFVQAALDPNLPQVRAIRVDLERVFANLVANAIESMADINSRPRILRIVTRVEESTIVATVEDSGTGFDSANAERMFHPFVTTKHGGTGIGLSICRSIVQGHGGQLWASHNKPYGSIFGFNLPV